MRTLLTFIAALAFLANTTAQDVTTEKKPRKVAKTEAVSTAPDASPKAGCCASKARGTAEAGKSSCGSKTEGKAEASATDMPAAEGSTGTDEGTVAEGEAKKAGCCAGMSEAEKKACCAGKAEAHHHDHIGGEKKVEEAPAAQPNH